MWGGGNKLRWVDICKTSLNWGLSNRLGGHGYVTNCKDKTNHAQDRDVFKSLISLNMVNTNQNGEFLSFWGKIVFKNLLTSEKEARNPLTSTV